MNINIQALANAFVVIDPQQRAHVEAFTPELYQRLDQHYDHFAQHQLVSLHTFTEDWPTWERHPAGDELVMLLSGAVTLIVQTESGEQSLQLEKPNHYVVVPKNCWHTMKTRTRSSMLFITPGEGTENTERPSRE